MTTRHIQAISKLYHRATRRLLLIDFDGTLVPISHQFVNYDQHEFHTLIDFLSSDQANDVIIISGRIREELDEIFNKKNVILVAEHGGFVKVNEQWSRVVEENVVWDQAVLSVLDEIVRIYPASFLQVKTLSLIWNYNAVVEKVEEEFVLTKIASVLPEGAVVYQEIKSFEIRRTMNGKNIFARWWLSMKSSVYQFILAIGDGRTDEDLFKEIGEKGITIKVGNQGSSCATFTIKDQSEVITFLEKISS